MENLACKQIDFNFHSLIYSPKINIKSKIKHSHRNFKYTIHELILKSNNSTDSKIMYLICKAYLEFIKAHGWKYTNSMVIDKQSLFLWYSKASKYEKLNKKYFSNLWNSTFNSKLFNKIDENSIELINVSKLFSNEELDAENVLFYIPKIDERTTIKDITKICLKTLYSLPTKYVNGKIEVTTQKEVGKWLNLSANNVNSLFKDEKKIYCFEKISQNDFETLKKSKNSPRLVKIDNLGYDLKKINNTGEFVCVDNIHYKLIGTKLLNNFKFSKRKLGKEGRRYTYRLIKNIHKDENSNILYKTFKANEKINDFNINVQSNNNGDNIPSNINVVSSNLSSAISKVKVRISINSFLNQLSNVSLIRPNTKLRYRKINQTLSLLTNEISKSMKEIGEFVLAEYIWKNYYAMRKVIDPEFEKYFKFKSQFKRIKRKYKFSMKSLQKIAYKRNLKSLQPKKIVDKSKEYSLQEQIALFKEKISA